MVRLLIFLAAAALVLLLLALIACLSAERVRRLPRPAWVLAILFVPLAGPLAYFAWGRPATRTPSRPRRTTSGPDDDPEFLRSMDVDRSRRDRESLDRWERDLREHRDREPDDHGLKKNEEE